VCKTSPLTDRSVITPSIGRLKPNITESGGCGQSVCPNTLTPCLTFGREQRGKVRQHLWHYTNCDIAQIYADINDRDERVSRGGSTAVANHSVARPGAGRSQRIRRARKLLRTRLRLRAVHCGWRGGYRNKLRVAAGSAL